MKQDDVGVTIVMATFMGERYVRQQIRSIQRQTHRNWRLIVRDDESADRTASIVTEMSADDPRIRLVTDSMGRLGFCQNFNELLVASAGDPYVMCSDQDDLWFEDKVEVTLREMRNSEEASPGTPTLVFTDHMVSDENNAILARSSSVIDNIRGLASFDLRSLLGYNYVWGCTTMVNRQLLEVALPVPRHAESHDYWLALTASALGRIVFLDRPTMLYRRHSGAATGGSDVNSWGARIRRHVLAPRELAEQVAGTELQMAAFNDFLLAKGHPDALLQQYVQATRHRRMAKVWRLMRLKVRRQGLGQDLAYYFHALLGS